MEKVAYAKKDEIKIIIQKKVTQFNLNNNKSEETIYTTV